MKNVFEVIRERWLQLGIVVLALGIVISAVALIRKFHCFGWRKFVVDFQE